MPPRIGQSTIPALIVATGLLCVAPVEATVDVEGIDGARRDNVLALMELAGEPCDAPAWRIRQRFSEADDQAKAALQVYGYYNVTVDSSLDLEADCWQARFDIEPGEPVRVRDLRIDVSGPGAGEKEFRRIVERAPLAAGGVLQHRDYESLKKRLVDTANRFGYFESEFTRSRIDVYPESLAADVELVFDTGPRYRFGEIRFDQDVVDRKLADRYVNFDAGDPYDANEIGELYENLLVSGYFDQVEVLTSPREAELDVPVTIVLTAAKPRTYTAGLGFGTDTGIKVRAGFEHRRLNRAGHQFELSGSYSTVIAEAGASYRLPLQNPRDEWLNFDLAYRREDTDTSLSEQVKFGIKRFKLRGADWLETQFIDIGYEDYEVGLDSGRAFLPVPGISWSRVHAEVPPRPLRGHRLTIRFSGSLEVIGADTDFLQTDIIGKFVRPLWPGGRVLVRGEAGFTAKDGLRELPASVRYFAGGDTSVRGYDFKTLGPTDEFGIVTGGSHLLVGSVEIDQRVRENWSVAVFADTGNAFEDFDDVDAKTGVGGGLRWYSPLGPIRLDVAVPLADDAPDDFRIHITLGPDL